MFCFNILKVFLKFKLITTEKDEIELQIYTLYKYLIYIFKKYFLNGVNKRYLGINIYFKVSVFHIFFRLKFNNYTNCY